jgi:hypothetical protein
MIKFKSKRQHLKWSEGYILEDSPGFSSLQSCAAELQKRRRPFKKTLTSYLLSENISSFEVYDLSMYFHMQEMQQHVFNKRQEVP